MLFNKTLFMLTLLDTNLPALLQPTAIDKINSKIQNSNNAKNNHIPPLQQPLSQTLGKEPNHVGQIATRRQSNHWRLPDDLLHEHSMKLETKRTTNKLVDLQTKFKKFKSEKDTYQRARLMRPMPLEGRSVPVVRQGVPSPPTASVSPEDTTTTTTTIVFTVKSTTEPPKPNTTLETVPTVPAATDYSIGSIEFLPDLYADYKGRPMPDELQEVLANETKDDDLAECMDNLVKCLHVHKSEKMCARLGPPSSTTFRHFENICEYDYYNCRGALHNERWTIVDVSDSACEQMIKEEAEHPATTTTESIADIEEISEVPKFPSVELPLPPVSGEVLEKEKTSNDTVLEEKKENITHTESTLTVHIETTSETVTT